LKVKRCPKCETRKTEGEFYTDKSKIDGKDAVCIECRKIYNRSKKRVERKKELSKNYPNDKAKRNARHKERMQSDEGYLMRKRRHRYISTYLSAIKEGKEVKKPSYIELIGCDSNEFKKHIESQFDGEMTWSNHGTLWTVDHVIPLKLDTPSAYRYTNCRPLRKDRHKARPLDLSDLPHTPIGILDVRSFHSLE
jgi:hypothetical protein